MVFLPRIARALHHPALAGFLGLVLIGIGIFGLASGDIPKVWTVLLLVIGVINLSRLLVRHPEVTELAPIEA
jgi:hypothetical protein